jgi:pilus assembly protein CpaC
LRRLVLAFGLAGAVPAAAGAGDGLHLDVGAARLVELPRTPETVFVADPEVASVKVASARRVLITGAAVGSTTFFALADGDGGVIARRRIVVRRDLSDLRGAVREAAAPNLVEVRALKDGVMLTGEVDSPATAERVVSVAQGLLGLDADVRNHMTVQAPVQVNLRVRVAEMSRRVAKRLGINWDALLDTGDLTLGLVTGRSAVNASGLLLDPQGAFESGAFGSAGAGLNGQEGGLNGVIDALAQEDLVSVLAEPNLTAKSGQTASFLAGGEFPIPVGVDDDNDVTIEFREFGVSLEFTPTVLSRNRIDLRIRTEVSELTDVGSIETGGIRIPALRTNRAETSVEMASGQSFAIAGLLQETTEDAVEKFPGLSAIPVLGSLFASTGFQRDQTELVILTTPTIVRPTSRKALALPQDGYSPANDQERILDQQLGKTRPATGGGIEASGDARLHGNAGFAY